MLQYCKDLEIVLMLSSSSDTDALELYEELKLRSRVVALESRPQDGLKFIYERHVREINPNAVIDSRILVTIP